MSKRANGEGNIRQRQNGRWEGRVSYIDPATDKRRSVSVYGATAKECRDKLKRVRTRIEAGKPAKDATASVAAFLSKWRETALEASDRKPTTKSLYSSLCRTHLESGAIGRKRINKLRPTDVEAVIVEVRGKGLADSTVRQVFTVLSLALDIAVRDGLLAANPVSLVKRPAVARKEATYLSSAEVMRLLEAAKGLRYYVAVLMLASTGLRRGEACGLAWSSCHLDKGELRVKHTLSRVDGELVLTEPKTTRSRRTVPLHPGLVMALKAWRKQQVRERLAAGDQWTDTGLVFATELGSMVDPRNLLRTVEIAAKKAKIEGVVGAHTMRHSAAVAWLESGTHIKAVADLLGHFSISITGDLYGHTSDATARGAVDSLGKALGL